MAVTQVPLVPWIFGGFLRFYQEQAKTASYVIVASDNGTLFTNFGAVGSVTFTLPLLAANYLFGFFINADQTVVIQTNATDNTKLVAFNNVAATSLTFSTGGARLGGGVVLQSNNLGTLWYTFNQSAGANTITIA